MISARSKDLPKNSAASVSKHRPRRKMPATDPSREHCVGRRSCPRSTEPATAQALHPPIDPSRREGAAAVQSRCRKEWFAAVRRSLRKSQRSASNLCERAARSSPTSVCSKEQFKLCTLRALVPFQRRKYLLRTLRRGKRAVKVQILPGQG